MGSKLSDDKKNLIRKRLCQGCTHKEIAEELQITERTVIRYKKKSPVPFYKEQDTGDNSIKIDYSTSLTKRENAFAKKIEKEIALYQDEEEGWIFHLSSHDARLKQSGLWWSAIVYPESAPEGWISKLRAQGLRIAISPLHDKDKWNHDSPEMVNAETGEIIPSGERYKAGDRKKAHWHIIVIVDKSTGYSEMNALLQDITHCPYIQKCRSLKNAFDYFLHINAPEKYQGYDKNEIQKYNKFTIEPNKYEVALLFDEVLTVIREKGYTDWGQVIDLYLGQPEYILILSSKPHLITEVLKSEWRRANPGGRIQKIKIMKEEVFE